MVNYLTLSQQLFLSKQVSSLNVSKGNTLPLNSPNIQIITHVIDIFDF